jgi:pyridoxamine 5'-phosphate oxidase
MRRAASSGARRTLLETSQGSYYLNLRAGGANENTSGRRTLTLNELTSGDFTDAREPVALFKQWFEEARASEPSDPEAMALATVDRDGLPNARMVLMKDFGENGLVFYTNAESAKGGELAATPKAAALFHWKSLRRQIRVRGAISEVSDETADAYFKSRPRDSRIGAWASQQSRPLESRFAFEKAIAFYAAKYAIGDPPRPAYWRGYRLLPTAFEFWRDRPFRLHDRVQFLRESPNAPWRSQRLYP